MNYAGFWIRFLAYIADSLIVGIAFLAIVALLGVMGLELASNELILFVMGLLYYAFMQSSPRQATYGKALVGLKVGGLEGERISFGRALGREVAKILSFLTLFLGFIIAGFTQRKQALHDFMATTTVARTEPGHVVAALAVAVVTLLAPFVVVFMLGAGAVAGMLGGIAGVVLTSPVMTAEAPKPAPAKPPVVVPTKPAPVVAEAPKPVAEAPKPAAVVIPASAPIILAQAVEPPKPKPEPAKEEPKPEPAMAEPAKPEPAKLEPVAQEEPKPEPVAPRVIPGPVTPGPKYNDLATAVLYRDPKAVEELLAFGKWPDKPDPRGVTPLMLAAGLGDAASAAALLKAGADPNRTGPGGDTATSIARERQDAAVLRLLQQYGGR